MSALAAVFRLLAIPIESTPANLSPVEAASSSSATVAGSAPELAAESAAPNGPHIAPSSAPAPPPPPSVPVQGPGTPPGVGTSARPAAPSVPPPAPPALTPPITPATTPTLAPAVTPAVAAASAAAVRPVTFEPLNDLFPLVAGTQELAVGNFATIYRVRARDGRQVVVKAFAQNVRVTMARAEVKHLTRVQRHDNVVGTHGLFAMDHPSGYKGYALVLEFVEGCNLFQMVRRTSSTPSHRLLGEMPAHRVMRGLLGGLAHIHSRGVVHRDVTPYNVLVRRSGDAVLTDFAVAASLRDGRRLRQRCGTPGYLAPEVIRREAYGSKVDVFSAGAALYFLIAGSSPFYQAGDQLADVLRKTLESPLDLSRGGWPEASANCEAVVKLLTRRGPEHRCTAQEAFEHEWFANETS